MAAICPHLIHDDMHNAKVNNQRHQDILMHSDMHPTVIQSHPMVEHSYKTNAMLSFHHYPLVNMPWWHHQLYGHGNIVGQPPNFLEHPCWLGHIVFVEREFMLPFGRLLNVVLSEWRTMHDAVMYEDGIDGEDLQMVKDI
eukprot:6527938-Ditylum_brightwellii.AAC.1